MYGEWGRCVWGVGVYWKIGVYRGGGEVGVYREGGGGRCVCGGGRGATCGTLQ